MRIIAQVVDKSSVSIEAENVKNSIAKGLTLLVGFEHNDNEAIAMAMAKKVCNLRVFVDENDKMNLSVKDIEGEILSISQFTLYADTRKGNRPGFSDAMHPDQATKLYDYFNQCLEENGIKPQVGIFGADMVVDIVNHGPVTIILDSAEIVKTK